MKKSGSYVFVLGMAIFLLFFGAGNLIFPPYLGLVAGEEWIPGLVGFLIADIGLAIITLVAIGKRGGDAIALFLRSGRKLAIVLAILTLICLGPLLAIPRTGAVTFEVGIAQVFPGISSILVSIIFFGLVFIFTIRPSKIVDVLGKYLTPLLVLTLLVLIIKGIVTPLGDLTYQSSIEGSVFAEGILQGYQTMDVLGGIAFGNIVIMALIQHGYKSQSEHMSMMLKAGIVAGIILAIIYGGLTFLGASYAPQFFAANPDITIGSISNADILVSVTKGLLGDVGLYLLAIIVSLACITTAIGLTAAVATFFNQLSNGRLKYSHLIIVICVFSTIVTNLGLDTIISISAPILSVIYPAILVLILLTLFFDRVKNDNMFKVATYVTLVYQLIEVGGGLFGFDVSFLAQMPFAFVGFGWIIPAILGAIVGYFIPQKKNGSDDENEKKELKEYEERMSKTEDAQ